MKKFKLIIFASDNEAIDPDMFFGRKKTERIAARKLTMPVNSYIRGGGGGGGDRRQRVIFKANYSAGTKVFEKFVNYITRKDKGIGGINPSLFSDDRDSFDSIQFDLTRLANGLKSEGGYEAPHFFRFIISPENKSVPMDLLVNEFMKRLGLATGFEFYWAAATHYNTAHPHAHIVVPGVDKKGNTIKFTKDMISVLPRSICRDIATELVGERTMMDLKEDREKLVVSTRVTKYDKLIRTALDNDTFAGLEKLPDSHNIRMRIDFLKSLGLCCMDKSSGGYTFTPDWETKLSSIGRYSSFRQSQINSRLPPHRFTMHDIRKDGDVSGRIVTRYYMQDDSNSHAVVLELPDGCQRYVPLRYGLDKNIKNGAMLSIRSSTTDEGRTRVKIREIMKGK